MSETTAGLKLALQFIDSKLTVLRDFSLTSKDFDYLGKEGYNEAKARIYGATQSLQELRERIDRALGPDQ